MFTPLTFKVIDLRSKFNTVIDRAVSFQKCVNYILSSYASITLSFTRNGKKRVLVASAKNVTNPTAIEKRSSVPRA